MLQSSSRSIPIKAIPKQTPTRISEMKAGKQYLVEGRCVGIDNKGIPVIEYKLEDAIRIPMSTDFLAPDIPREVTLSGFGKVVNIEPFQQAGEVDQPPSMICTKQDYNTFDVGYVIRQSGDMLKSYHLIKTGVVISVTGNLAGYGTDGKTWLAEATWVAIKRMRKTGRKKFKNAKKLPSKLNKEQGEMSKTCSREGPKEDCCCHVNRGEGGSTGPRTSQEASTPIDESPEELQTFSTLDIKGKGKEKERS